MILSVFNCDKSSGYIYIEAYNMSHVKSFIQGISGIIHYSGANHNLHGNNRRSNIEMIPFREMTQLLKVCSEINESTLQQHQWVRVKSGPYAGDLGLVETIEDGKRALVRVIPRIHFVQSEDGHEKMKLVVKSKSLDKHSMIRIQQRFFNPSMVKNECHKIKYQPLNKHFYQWSEQLFRNGFLYLFFNLSKLQQEGVQPQLEEVQRFQRLVTQMEDFHSDQDEWDVLNDETLKKTIKHESEQKFDIGDRVILRGRQCNEIKGEVLKNIENGEFSKRHSCHLNFILVLIRTLEKVPYELKAKSSDAAKYFECGESVRVIAGLHSGGSGVILALTGGHAVVSMDSSKSELKILQSNLKLKKNDEMEHVKFEDFIKKDALDIKYLAGDMILYTQQPQLSLGLVIHVHPDFMRVLNEKNIVVSVKQSEVTRKIFPRYY